MKKFFLFIFILVDLAVIAASVVFLAAKLGSNKVPPLSSFSLGNKAVSSPGATAPAGDSASASAAASSPFTTPDAKPGSSASRKILFTYRSSRPKKVMIRADFTGWRAEPMEKDIATQTWKYMAVLEPGEYSYLFSVDDKPARDPANKRTKKVGTTVVSSLVVGPLSSAPQ